MKRSELKNIIKEEISKVLSENKNPYYVLGFEVGPNAKKGIDSNSEEANEIFEKAGGPLWNLDKDENVVQFVKGYVDSVSSRSVRYNGIDTIVNVLTYLRRRGWPKPGNVL